MHQFGDWDHPKKGPSAEEGEAEIDQAGELEKGENKNKDCNRDGDDGTSGEPKSNHSFTGRGGKVVSLSLHGDEGQEEHPEEKENTSQAEGKGSLQALWPVGVKGTAASVAVSGLSFFD